MPEVTTPPPTTGLPWRAIPWPVTANGTSRSAVPSARSRAAHGVGADEAGRLLAAPAEAGLDRAAVLGQVVAVEVEARLQAQRVARAQADGVAPAATTASQTAAARAGRDEQLDAVLARVAGAADEHARHARDGRSAV